MIDPKFTEQIAKWLDAEHTTTEQIEAGAQLLLSLNRDRSMYQRIMHNPKRELKFLEYKLRRFLRLRKDGQTIRDVVALDSKLTPEIQSVIDTEPSANEVTDPTLPVLQNTEHGEISGAVVRKGIRPDHDRLPADIQAIWTANAERWKKIKEAFETCKSLTEPCDRYEYLKVLKDTWYKYKQEMARYDDYRLTADGGSKGDGAAEQTPALTPEQEKELKNADSYISKNMPQLLMLVSVAKEEEFNEGQIKNLENLRQRIQQRVDVLLKYGRTLTEERSEQLKQCDIKLTLDTPEDNEQGKESE